MINLLMYLFLLIYFQYFSLIYSKLFIQEYIIFLKSILFILLQLKNIHKNIFYFLILMYYVTMHIQFLISMDLVILLMDINLNHQKNQVYLINQFFFQLLFCNFFYINQIYQVFFYQEILI